MKTTTTWLVALGVLALPLTSAVAADRAIDPATDRATEAQREDASPTVTNRKAPDTTDTRTERTNADRKDVKETKDAIRAHPGGLIETKWVVDRPVVDARGKEIGKVTEIWFDPKSGQVKEAVVQVGGTLGIGAKHKLVAWKDLNVAWEDQKIVVRMDENALGKAQSYEPGERTRGRGSEPSASPATERRSK